MMQIREQNSGGTGDNTRSYMWERAEQMKICRENLGFSHLFCLTGVWVPRQKKCQILIFAKALFLVHRSLPPTQNMVNR